MKDNILNIIIGTICLINISAIPKDINFYLNKTKLQKENSKSIKIALIKNFKDLELQKINHPHIQFSEKDKKIIEEIIKNLKNKNAEIYYFVKKLLENTNINNLKNLILNLPYIKIKYNSENIYPNITGTYDGLTKEINIYKDQTKASLYHELLHASSSDAKFMCIGFKIVLKNDIIFGKGLNEGYTELLNNRFFGVNSKSYIYLQKLAQEIEKLCKSKEKMIENYFNADIFSLIGELMQKMSLEEIIDILVDMDNLVYEDNPNYIEYIKIKEKIQINKSKNKIKKLLVNTANYKKQKIYKTWQKF